MTVWFCDAAAMLRGQLWPLPLRWDRSSYVKSTYRSGMVTALPAIPMPTWPSSTGLRRGLVETVRGTRCPASLAFGLLAGVRPGRSFCVVHLRAGQPQGVSLPRRGRLPRSGPGQWPAARAGRRSSGPQRAAWPRCPYGQRGHGPATPQGGARWAGHRPQAVRGLPGRPRRSGPGGGVHRRRGPYALCRPAVRSPGRTDRGPPCPPSRGRGAVAGAVCAVRGRCRALR